MGGAVSIGKGDPKASRFATTSVIPTATKSGNNSMFPNGGLGSKRKLTMRHTVRLDTETAQKIQSVVLEMSKTGRLELTSAVDREGSMGTLTRHGLHALQHIPEIVFSMLHLTELNLRCNEISELPKEIDALVALRVLVLSKNKIAVLPRALTKLTKLRVLEVASNQLTALPEELGNMESLEVLLANRNQITKLPDSIGYCMNLRILNVYNNALTELGKPVSILPELVELNVSNNQLTKLPSALLRWKNLRRLLLQVNHLESLPALDALCNLEVLQLQQNELKSLPSMKNLVHLVKLDANSNCIAGLPAEVAHMTALAHVNLRRNEFKEIPPQLARCQAMEILDLGANPINSPIPPGFAELSKLRTLLLDGCNITLLPIELIGLSSVCRVHLGACLQMDDPETCEVVLGLRDSCSRKGGWLKTGDWKTDHRTESMSSDLWELYDELEGQIPDEPARKSRVKGGQGSTDFFAGRTPLTQC
ncbi:PH domain leucine-rich repeat-containing protein phosphatase 2 [Phytophthora pseudosyringae]|uniref:PH domain leucine-rich repeat-containing protein phosphatase 2 n=1 Tax=Phytophthora pseudosyringae TaxID=221518 RepID=A0A8T1VTT9_9STRA|nr:PH domain leucine-rich repeat-containing protein phosphatase 2 [Phytophthora pseudosyringae]